MTRPKLAILDEPTSGLEVKTFIKPLTELAVVFIGFVRACDFTACRNDDRRYKNLSGISHADPVRYNDTVFSLDVCRYKHAAGDCAGSYIRPAVLAHFHRRDKSIYTELHAYRDRDRFVSVLLTIAVRIFNSDKLFTLGQIMKKRPAKNKKSPFSKLTAKK